MLAPIKHLLGNYRIVLASGSPRRQELVKMLVCCSRIHIHLEVEPL